MGRPLIWQTELSSMFTLAYHWSPQFQAMTCFHIHFHWGNLSYICQQTPPCFLTTCWICLSFPMTLLIFLFVSFCSTMYSLQIERRLLKGAYFFLNLPHISLLFPSLNFLLLSYFQFVCAILQFYSLAHQLFSSAVHFPQSALWLGFLCYFAPLGQHFFHRQGQQHSSGNKLHYVFKKN